MAPDSTGHFGTRHRFRYRWIIQIDEDVAFNTISSFSTFLEAAQSALPEHAQERCFDTELRSARYHRVKVNPVKAR